MWQFLKIALLFLHLASATSVEHDETSLVQLNKILMHGSDRLYAKPQPIVTWKAEAESMPGEEEGGRLQKAFKNNIAKVKSVIEEKAAGKISFDKEVVAQRLANKEAVEASIAGLDGDVERVLRAGKANLARVAQNKATVEKEAIATVDRAMEDAEARAIEKKQAEEYAVEGRLEGAAEAEDSVRRMQTAADREAREAEQERLREKEASAEKKRQEEERDAVNKVTDEEKKAEQDYANRKIRDAKAEEVHIAAEVGRAEEAIEGPEAMKNHIISYDASHVSDQYEQKAAADERRINEAADAEWPEGHWPDP